MTPETDTTPTQAENPAPPPKAPKRGAHPPDGPRVATITSAATSKGNIYRLPPEAILVPKEMNGRKYGTSDFKDLIRDFLNPLVGQLQPIGVRQTKDGPAVAYGFRRLAAALEINEMGLAKEPFLIDCISVKGNDDDAYLKNVLENIQRQSTSPIDDAFNIDRLITEFGKSREEVAKLFGKGGKARSQSWISQTLKLLTLPPDVQKKVHSGEIGVAAAYELADADEETQKAIIKSDGKASKTVEAVREAKREAQEKENASPKSARSKTAKSAKPKTGRKPKEDRGRSVKEVRVFFTQLSEFWCELGKGKEKKLFELYPDARKIDPDGTVAALGKELLSWLDGKGTNKSMARKLLKFGAMVE
jgi:ParB family chromosome partitioning protein